MTTITAAGVVPCGGPKKYPRTSSIVQVMFSFWSFEISEDILRNQKFIIGLDSFSDQCLTYLVPFSNTSLCIHNENLPMQYTDNFFSCKN